MRKSSSSGKQNRMESGYSVVTTGNGTTDAELRDMINHADDDTDEDDEYEYVTIGEYFNPISGKIGYWASELSVFIVCIAIFAIGSLLIAISDSFSTTMIVAAIILLSIIAAFTIYYAWNDRKEKQAIADKAQMIHDFVSQHLEMNGQPSNGNDD